MLMTERERNRLRAVRLLATTAEEGKEQRTRVWSYTLLKYPITPCVVVSNFFIFKKKKKKKQSRKFVWSMQHKTVGR